MNSLQRISGLTSDALDFVPDILSIQERPTSPMPRLVLQGLFGLFVLAFIWACLGRLDITAVAQGKIVPQSYLQIVQPSDAGVIQELLVKEGDEVKAGQILVRMDAKISEADIKTLDSELQSKSLQLRRVDAELSGAPLARRAKDPSEMFSQIDAQYRARRQAYVDAVESERAVLAKAEFDLKAASEIEAKLKRTVPIYKDQADSWEKLAREGYAGRLLALERQRSYIESEQDLRAQTHTLEGLRATIVQSEKRMAQITSNYRQQLQNERVEAEALQRKLQQDWEKLSHRHSLLELKAPQDGVVKDMMTHTVGSVVSPGTVVMTLVPHNDPMQAEVWVTNPDAGFVEPKQAVKLKIIAYTFQKYGMIEGEVKQISPDATELSESKGEKSKELQDNASPSSYRTIVTFKIPYLEVDGKRYKVSPGMQVSAEINLGTRSVIEYLLSPVRKTVHEAGRER